MNTLNRYLLSEFISLVNIGIAIVSIVWFSSESFRLILSMMPRLGMSFSQLFTMILCAVPEIISANLAVALFIGTVFLVKALKQNGELTSLLTSGWHPIRILQMPIVVSIIMAIFCFHLHDTIVPLSLRSFENHLTLAVSNSKSPTSLFKKNTIVRVEPKSSNKRVVVVARKPNREADKSLILNFDDDNCKLITGERILPTKTSWEVNNGNVFDFALTGQPIRVLEFEHLSLPSNIPVTIKNSSSFTNLSFLSTSRLLEKLNTKSDERLPEIAFRISHKLASALSCLVLVAINLAILKPARKSFTAASDYAFAALVTILFYSTESCARSLALSNEGTIIQGFLLAWVPNLLVVLFALNYHHIAKLISSPSFKYPFSILKTRLTRHTRKPIV